MLKTKKVLLIPLLLFIAMLMPMGTVSDIAYADDDPAPIQDLYTIDGVNYYNTGSESFAESQYQYLKEVMGNGSNELVWDGVQSGYKRSMSDLWLELAGGLMMGREPTEAAYMPIALDRAACQGSNSRSFQIGNQWVDTDRYEPADMKSSDMRSLKRAEEYVYRVAEIGSDASSTGYFKDKTDESTVVVGAIKSAQSSSNYRVAAVYFTNFRVVALFPEDTGKNYITTITKDDTTYTNSVASTVRNNTGTAATGSQKVSSSYTASMQSSVSGSETYSYQEGISVSNEFAPGFFNKFKVDVSFTATQAFQKGWSEGKGVSESNGSEQSVSVNLPAYTNVMMTQKTTNAEAVTRYNCPVGVTFDATIVIYDQNGVRKVDNKAEVFKFEGTARNTLKSRYKEWKGEDSQADEEGILWGWVTRYDNNGDTHMDEAINKASAYVPMAPTGAEFRQKLKLVAGEIDGLMPILPLHRVSLDPLSIPMYGDNGSYNGYNYLEMKMPVGGSAYTTYFKLSGYNANDVPYFGFSRIFGKWKVVDENGDEWTGDDAPAIITKETAFGNETVKAVKPGVCYLKYFIKEDAYNTSGNPEHYTTNDELSSTAVIRITVTDDRTISVSGGFQGYVDEDPEAIDADGKLYAAVCDATGKEIDADVTWEKKEKKNITLEGNMVSFTKPGTYHVRACCDGVKSEWVEIKAKYRPVSLKDGGTAKLAETEYTYDGKEKTPGAVVTRDGKSLVAGTDYTVSYKKNKNAGTATAVITGIGLYCDDLKVDFVIKKAANPLTVKAKTATVKYKKLKKKAQALKVSKVIKVTKKGQGTMQYKLYSAKKGTKNFKKYFKVASKSGKVTMKKGLKKGTYKVKVKVKAGGNANYKASAWKTVTFKISVK